MPARYTMMAETLSKHYYNGSVSQAHQDMTDDRYRDLRRPRKVRFYCNGDRYFRGKKLYITPHRYMSFKDLLDNLTDTLTSNASLPHGVRQIFTPIGGRKIQDIEDLQDGQSYVCAGFDKFRPIKYGKGKLKNWIAGRPHNHDTLPALSMDFGGPQNQYSYGAFAPGKQLRHSYPKHGMMGGGAVGATRNSYLIHSDASPMKPKVITVVRNGPKPRTNVKILLNRRSVQSYEQLMSDIAESFGPKWKNNRIRKLYTLKGKEVVSISDFFRDDEVFVGLGQESLSPSEVQDIYEELYPDGPYSKAVARQWERQQKKRPVMKYVSGPKEGIEEESKRDSGYGDSEEKDEDEVEIVIKKPDARPNEGYPQKKGNGAQQRQKDLQWRLNQERERAANEDRERARKRMQKRLADERKIMDEERRKHDLVLVRQEDPFKKMDRERKEEEKRRRESEERRGREDEERRQRELELELERQKREQERKKREQKEKRTPANSPDRHTDRQSPPYDLRPTSGAKHENGEKDRKPEHEDDDANNNNNSSEKENQNKQNLKNKDLNDGALKDKDRGQGQRKRSRTSSKFKLGKKISVAQDSVYTKYEPGKTLGDGNFAIVKSCKLRKTDQDYAMKIIDKSKLKGKEHMIESEVDIMKNCNQANIVKLYEEYETNSEIFLIMELVKGGDLFDAITQSVKFSEPEAASMCRDVCNALFYLHSRNIVHRDLKPENLMVCRNKDNSITLKLGDFGLAMDVKERIYTVCGTPTYVAPEILSEIGYGLEVDIWALGVITYILLCGFPPFRSPDRKQTELFDFIKSGEFEYLSPYWDSISQGARDLIDHLLVVKTKKRYTAIDVLCHPWVISYGGSMALPDNLPEYQSNLRKQLEVEAKSNLESYQQWRKERNSRLAEQ